MKKIIALYLPQFHEFKENNFWWGEGFTEWTCVNRGKSRIEGHRIKKPHADIGYYNLLDFEVRKKQAKLAKKYNVYGFCYYHYWFGDKVLMDAPLQLMLQDGEPDLPFCFSWANEPWTRRMNGGNGELLQSNNYGDQEEWQRHLNYLLPFFKHKNYIKINNKPLFVIYRVSQIPNYKQRFDFYRESLKKHGFDGVFFIMTIGNFQDNFYELGKHVDAVFDFYPNFLWQNSMIDQIVGDTAFYDMKKAYQRVLSDKRIHERHFKGTLIGFDSSPRSPLRCNVFINGSPNLFQNHLEKLLSNTSEEFVFVNAWNEWGEGCALEPEEKDGYGYLQALKSVVGLHNMKV
jgi:hypothetical protein